MAKDILDAVYGCLVAGAIGDALGAHVEGWYWTEIREKYGRVEEFILSERDNTGPRYGQGQGGAGVKGAVTDDTTLRHYMCLAIVRRAGRITPDDFAAIWLEKLNPNRFWKNEQIVTQKLRIGMNPWDTGKGQPPTGCATMAIAPMGIINAGNPRQAYQDAFNIAFVNQDNENRDGAATTAAGVAAAFTPGATVESVIAAMIEHSSYVVKRSLILTMDLAYASNSVDEFAEKFYAKMLDWTWPFPPERGEWNKNRYFSGSSLEIVPVVAGLLHLCQGDVNRCIIEGASFGRDCDTISSVVGSIAAAMQGASAIRPDWIETVEAGNREFFEEIEGDPNANFFHMAQRMVDVMHKERQAMQDRATQLGQILGGYR
jgi:ADP-ribosylglycohydrolase